MGYHHYHHFIHHSADSSSSSSFWGAFAGAFFAFVFGLISYAVIKRRERFVLHKNSIVKLERVLNKHLDDLTVFESMIREMKVIFNDGKVPTKRLFHIEIPQGIDMELGSIDLVNKLLAYEIGMNRLNFDSSGFNHAVTRIEDLFINGRPVGSENIDYVKGVLDDFITALQRLNERTKKFLVLVRIHYRKIKDKEPYIYGVFNTQWEQDISDEEIKVERQKLEHEIVQVVINAEEF